VFTGLSDMEFTPNGTLYAAIELYPYVYRMDQDLNVLGTIPLSSTVGSIVWTNALALNADNTRAYVVVDDWDAPSYTYSVIDTNPTSATYNTEIAVVAQRTTALSPDGSRRYEIQPDGKTVVIYNTATNTVVGTFATDQNATSGIRSITVAPNGTLYIADAADNKVYVVTVGSTTAA
jgi:DNA-binding beta-propeller fold protein YncE